MGISKSILGHKLEGVDLKDAKEAVGEGTFNEEELQHFYDTFVNAKGPKGKYIVETQHKKYVKSLGLFPKASKNESFGFLFRACAGGSPNGISWESFLRYHLAIKFGFVPTRSPHDLSSNSPNMRPRPALAPTTGESTSSLMNQLGPSAAAAGPLRVNLADASLRSGELDTPSPSGAPSPVAAAVPVPSFSQERQYQLRFMLAEIYFLMLEPASGGGITKESATNVIMLSAKWTLDENASVAEEDVRMVVENIFGEISTPPPAGPISKDTFVNAFLVSDALANRLTQLL